MKEEFVIQTTAGKFRCEKSEKSVNGTNMTRWWIDGVLEKEDVRVEFQCPEDWAATRVFQFLDDFLTTFSK